MAQGTRRSKILITVVTYPHPSQEYGELVCTAGVTEDHEWVRLYPIDLRYQPEERRFHKYQWIEVDLGPQGKKGDFRVESRRPHLDSIRLLGDPLPTSDVWAERRRWVDALQHRTMNELRALYDSSKISLGIVRPKVVHEVRVEDDPGDWNAKETQALTQMRLFGGSQPKTLRRIPYKFSYVFTCEDSTTPHVMKITDWELGALFLNERRRLGSDAAAAESVDKKYMSLVDEKHDTRFFVGTTLPYNSWIVIGVFYPPKAKPAAQGRLFT